jgi:hypothetical protein
MSDLKDAYQQPTVAISPQTEALADRLLLNAQVMADLLPFGISGGEPFEMLLKIYAAEARAQYLDVNGLAVPSSTGVSVTRRWLKAMLAERLLEQRGPLVALTPEGHTLVRTILERMYAAQQNYR